MTRFIGEQKLQQEAQTAFPKGVHTIHNCIHFFTGYGASNAILVEGETSCILIDTFSSRAAAEEALPDIKKLTKKPVQHIIYTHYQHPDHIGGAAVLADKQCKSFARKADTSIYGGTERLQTIGRIRAGRQFGARLTLEEAISGGAGPITPTSNGPACPIPPTDFFSEETLNLTIDGIKLELVAAPGETDDQIFIWLPQYQVLCCGDNYYRSWPNLYAIRGSQYRDIYNWVDSLSRMLTYDSQYLFPGHSGAIVGKEAVKEVLTNYRDAIQYILEETLDGINKGRTMQQLVDTVKLPEKWASLPYLQEYYGTVEWSIRGIYSGYLGWFDGNPTALGSQPVSVKAEKTIALMGGADRVLLAAQEALAQEDEQWAVELCDLLIDASQLASEAKKLKAQALVILGRLQTSANGRHYYLSCAKELLSNEE